MKWYILPLGSLLNAVALLGLTLLGVPFSWWSVLLANAMLISVSLISIKPYLKTNTVNLVPRSKLRFFGVISIIVIGMSLLYGISHSMLPTFHYDSLTNWNIRSKMSYFRAELVFKNFNGLIEKPHYPVLHHALQVAAMQFVPGWHDSVANGVTLLLCLSLIMVIYRLLREKGFESALVTLAMLLSLPLLTLHLGQSYTDLPLVLFASSSLLLFQRFIERGENTDLLLSGIMVAACVWMKTEGLFFCFIPWLLMVIGTTKKIHREVIPAVVLAAAWPVFILASGYALTPHGSADAGLSFRSEALTSLLSALFIHGSFGIFWYLVLAASMWAFVGRLWSPLFVWPLLSFVGYCSVYVFTSNAEYLLLGQSFDRQMLLPAVLLVLTFSQLLTKNNNVVTQ